MTKTTQNQHGLPDLGLTAAIIGMQHGIDLMQAELARLRAELARLQNGYAPVVKAKREYTKRKEATVVPVPVAKAKQPAKARNIPALPAMIGDKHVLAHVAKELGFDTTWGLVLHMRSHGMKHAQAKLEGRGGQKINVITEAQYLRLQRMRAGEAEVAA